MKLLTIAIGSILTVSDRSNHMIVMIIILFILLIGFAGGVGEYVGVGDLNKKNILSVAFRLVFTAGV